MPNDAKTVAATYREASILPFFDDRMDIQFINLLTTHWIGPMKVQREESESESESFYSVLLQTQETSAKTYLVAVAEATWKKYIHECMYVKVKLVNTSTS